MQIATLEHPIFSFVGTGFGALTWNALENMARHEKLCRWWHQSDRRTDGREKGFPVGYWSPPGARLMASGFYYPYWDHGIIQGLVNGEWAQWTEYQKIRHGVRVPMCVEAA